MEQWSTNYIKMLELEIECMESNYFIPRDDSHTITLTLFVFFIKKILVIRLEETEDDMQL